MNKIKDLVSNKMGKNIILIPIILIAIVVALISFPSKKESISSKVSPEKKKQTRNITVKTPPISLINLMARNYDLASFQDSCASLIRLYSKDGDSLTKEDINDISEKFIKNTIKAEKVVADIADGDFDGKTSKDEIYGWLEKYDVTRLYRATSMMNHYDSNNDGMIDVKEMSEFNLLGYIALYKSQLNELFSFDANSDNKIDRKELSNLAQLVFKLVDKDHDSILSQSEIDVQLAQNKKDKSSKSNSDRTFNVIDYKSSGNDKFLSFGIMMYYDDLKKIEKGLISSVKSHGIYNDSDFFDERTIKTLSKRNNNEMVSERLMRNLRSFVMLDTNKDRKVTANELLHNSNRSHMFYIRSQGTLLDNFDSNSDDMVTFDEIYNIDSALASIEKHKGNDYRLQLLHDMMKIDPNHDGRVYIQEVKYIAQLIFETIDKNGDNIISPEEKRKSMHGFSDRFRSVLLRHQKDVIVPSKTQKTEAKPSQNIQPKQVIDRKKSQPQSTSCGMPIADQDQIIIAYGTYEGHALSSVSVSGQDRTTQTSTIVIEEGKNPIYLVLSSEKPMIWQMKGKTSRVEKVIIAGPVDGAGKINAGIVGVKESKKLYFVSAKQCFKSFYDNESMKRSRAKESLKKELGRMPDIIAGSYRTSRLSLPSESQTKVSRSDFIKNLDRGYGLYRFYPGGLVKIKAKDVFSHTKAQDYIVYPQQAGIKQLIEEKKLQPVANKRGEFKIVKPIGYFPAGLNGAHSVTFILGTNVAKPKGNPGHSCVISEESGELLFNSKICDYLYK